MQVLNIVGLGRNSTSALRVFVEVLTFATLNGAITPILEVIALEKYKKTKVSSKFFVDLNLNRRFGSI